MKVVRSAMVSLLAIALFASLAALALASPPTGNPAGGCGQGPPGGTVGPPVSQYGEPPNPPNPPGRPPGPPGGQYGGPPDNQYGGNGNNGTPGGPQGCPPHTQYGQYGSR